MEAVMHALGRGDGGYAIAAPSEMLMVRKHAEHPAELAQLSGARLVGARAGGPGFWRRVRLLPFTRSGSLPASTTRAYADGVALFLAKRVTGA